MVSRTLRRTVAALALFAAGAGLAAPPPDWGFIPFARAVLLEEAEEELTGGDLQLKELFAEVVAAEEALHEKRDPTGRATKAIAAGERLTGDAPRRGRAAYLRAQLHVAIASHAGRGPEAVKHVKAVVGDLDTALASLPGLPELRAEILAERGRARAVLVRVDAGAAGQAVPDLKAALGDLDQALALQPDWARALVERGRVELLLGLVVDELEGEDAARGELALTHLERALADFEGAARRAPGLADALTGAATALERLGRWPEAVERLEAASRVPGAGEPVRTELARARDAAARRPAALAAARARASKAIDAGDFTAAAKECEEALGTCGRDAETTLLRGQAFLYLGTLGHAEADLTRAVALMPGSALALALRGQVRAERKRLPEAVADLQRALAIDPQLLDAVFGLALAYLRMGDLDRSIEVGEKGVARGPEWFSGWYNLAAAYGRRSALPGRDPGARGKDRDRAFAALDAYARSVPRDPATRDSVSRDPELAALRTDPRFAAVLDRLGPARPGRSMEDWAEDTMR